MERDRDRITRRAALAMGGSLAVAAGVKGVVARLEAQGVSRVIDVHHHYFTPQWLAKRKDAIIESGGARFFGWTPQTSLEAMDKAGCSAAIVACGGPGVWNGEVEASRTLAREVNEF